MEKKKSFVLGIAGGTGSGKTTLAIELYKKYSDRCALLHLDDYFRKSVDIPKLEGFINWEDPSALRFDELYNDLFSLVHGTTITVNTKSELFNPNYSSQNPVKTPHVIEPKPIVILEGYMVLYDSRIRELLDLKVFLEAPLRESSQRRSATKDPVNQEYFEKVLEPMYKKIVEPTREFADIVIDVSTKNAQGVFDVVESKLPLE